MGPFFIVKNYFFYIKCYNIWVKIKKLNNLKSNTGFTLIELMVTIVIFVILTAVVLFSQSGFNNTVLLNNLAYDISLTIRQAQYYGVNVNESQSTLNPFTPYGVYFNVSSLDQVNGKTVNFIFFTDTLGDNNSNIPNDKYNPGTLTCSANSLECISKYNIGNGNYIKSICTILPNQSTCTPITNSLTIIFKRPNPNAIIFPDVEANGTGINNQASYADITVSSASGRTKDIIVTSVGQIYVQ